MRDKWIIECRTPEGKLDFTGPQPESVFGQGAIEGMDENHMSDVIFRHVPDAIMTGDSISVWPQLIDERWTARRKTW